MEKETILIGLSGGVDSAASAVILKDKGYHVIGATMIVWDPSLPVPEGPYQKTRVYLPKKKIYKRWKVFPANSALTL